MKGRGWQWYLSGALFAYLCMIVFCKKHRRGETYGDLGDEIIVDFPTHTNRKNQIPRRTYQRVSNNHRIDVRQPRTITTNTVQQHYLNPLYYREFTSAPYRRQFRPPVRPNVRQYVKPIPPWTKKHVVPPWSKKNIIHRPLAVNTPRMSNNFMRPPAYSRGRAVVAPRPKAAGVARKKWYQPRVAAPKTNYRAPASLRPRYMPKPAAVGSAAVKAKHRMHVQVLPPRAPLNPANAHQFGIHSGFVLLPARSQKTNAKKYIRQPMPQRLSLRKTKAGVRTISGPSRVSDRFSEKQHIWVPLDSAHFNKQQIPVNDVASYHIDEIGNLIPDISNPKFFEPQRGVKNKCRIPIRRDGICPLPSRPHVARPHFPAPKANVARNQRLPSRLPQQMARPVKLPPRAGVRKPLVARAKPKSSQRILYFAHNAKPINRAPPQTMRYQQPRKQLRLPPVRGKPPLARGARPPFLRPPSLQPPSQYEVPDISNKVYQYINERTSPAAASLNAPRISNPLVKYLQYHRAHNTPLQMLPPNRIDKRSLVTIIEQ